MRNYDVEQINKPRQHCVPLRCKITHVNCY